VFSNRNQQAQSVESHSPVVPDVVWSERFRDVTQATVTPVSFNEGKGTSLLLKLELSGASGKASKHPAESEVRTTLTVPVEERDAPALLRLLGKRVLLRELRQRDSLEKEMLAQQVNDLTLALEAALEREEALRSNLHTLVEGTRRLR
jgi:hypothetical protein